MQRNGTGKSTKRQEEPTTNREWVHRKAQREKDFFTKELRTKFKNDYDRTIYYLLGEGNYFHFFRDFLAVLSFEEAVVIQSLVNLGRGKSKDGWVRCSRSYLKKTLYIKDDVQHRILRRLKNNGWIEIEIRGLPGSRYVRVLLKELLEKVTEMVDPESYNTDENETATTSSMKIATTDQNAKTSGKSSRG